MVAYVLNKQETLLLSAVEGTPNNIIDVKKARKCINVMFNLALGIVILCIGIGSIGAHKIEEPKWVDAFYLSVMSVTTVGYGDHAFKTLQGRMFACVWLLFSTLFVARAVLYFAECKAKTDERKHSIAERVLQRAVTAEDLMAADMDHNGLVTKSEHVLYKLKEMKKVQDIDVVQITEQFDRLDCENSGRITLKSLLSGI
ncbi:hypothetical protein SUGI_0787950 [Cryptomeria japonica]|nr:hypothetical protein SUGI_0787950 [Cryptomeria japonica]